MKYRSRTEIIAQILEAAETPVTRTHIMYKAFLSHAQLKEYLEVLRGNNLINHDEKSQLYWTAAKGQSFLKLYYQVGELVADKEKTEPIVQSA